MPVLKRHQAAPLAQSQQGAQPLTGACCLGRRAWGSRPQQGASTGQAELCSPSGNRRPARSQGQAAFQLVLAWNTEARELGLWGGPADHWFIPPQATAEVKGRQLLCTMQVGQHLHPCPRLVLRETLISTPLLAGAALRLDNGFISTQPFDRRRSGEPVVVAVCLCSAAGAGPAASG